MKIELEYPFSDKWNKGYLVTNPENRKNVVLYNSNKDRTTISYGRYIMSVYLGRYLNSNEEVDHIDHDKTNDVISNLQILSKSENVTKENRRRGKQKADIKCPVCELVFSVSRWQCQATKCYKGRVVCCSRECANKHKVLRLSKDERFKVSEDTLLRTYTVYDEK